MKGCDHSKALEIIFNKNNVTQSISSFICPRIGAHQCLNTQSVSHVRVDDDSFDDDIQDWSALLAV